VGVRDLMGGSPKLYGWGQSIPMDGSTRMGSDNRPIHSSTVFKIGYYLRFSCKFEHFGMGGGSTFGMGGSSISYLYIVKL
jgi:hypothetical protein